MLARESTSAGVLLSSTPRRVRNVILIATRHTTMPLCYEYFDMLGLRAHLHMQYAWERCCLHGYHVGC